ncbi:MAG: type II toxin-antitoxin system RelB/DinJ family antitoxin [Defluviitaleaceae bacterium]|nr:type II toxin-antitoxin system RelB/DinJ family antitoxin [Defluviitaleaceae bacterium]
MMTTVDYTLSLDERDKQSAEEVFKELGMTLSTGINVYIKTVSRQRRIPFNLTLTETIPALTDASEQEERDKIFTSLRGVLAGHEVDLDKEREEKILSR